MECCVACNRELEYCECEAGQHIYGDQHNLTWEDNCPESCPAYKLENGKWVKNTEADLIKIYQKNKRDD